MYRRGSLMPSAVVNQRESSVAQPPGQTDPAASGSGNFIHQVAAGATGSSSSTRESEVRVVPIRTFIAAVPAPVGHAPSDSSRGSVGLMYPLLARVQHLTSRNLNGTSASQVSDEHHRHVVDIGRQSIPDSAVQQFNIGVPGVDGGGMQHVQGFSSQVRDGLDQLLRTIFPGEQIHGGDANFQEMGTSSATGHLGTTQSATNSQDAASPVGDEEHFCLIYCIRSCPSYLETRQMGQVFHMQTEQMYLKLVLHKFPQHKLRRIQMEGPLHVIGAMLPSQRPQNAKRGTDFISRLVINAEIPCDKLMVEIS